MDELRELDAEIERRVFGRDADATKRSWQDGYMCEDTFYSTDIAAAWLVVEALAQAPYYIGVVVGTFGTPHAKCYRDSKLIAESWTKLNALPDTRTLSERCALAICRAALLAVA